MAVKKIINLNKTKPVRLCGIEQDLLLSFMSKTEDIFKFIFKAASRIEEGLLNIAHGSNNGKLSKTLSSRISPSLKNLEVSLSLLIKNTDLLTKMLRPELLQTTHHEATKNQLQKVSLLARNLERELSDPK